MSGVHKRFITLFATLEHHFAWKSVELCGSLFGPQGGGRLSNRSRETLKLISNVIKSDGLLQENQLNLRTSSLFISSVFMYPPPLVFVPLLSHFSFPPCLPAP